MTETAIERMVRVIFRGDWQAYLRSLPERVTVEGPGGWYTVAR